VKDLVQDVSKDVLGAAKDEREGVHPGGVYLTNRHLPDLEGAYLAICQWRNPRHACP